MKTKKEIIEGNKLIAEFMGIPKIEVWGGGVLYDLQQFGELPMTTIPVGDGVVETRLWKYSESQLKFHSSWDWLIPACVKFTEIKTFDSKAGNVHNRDPYFSQRIDDLCSAVSSMDISKAHDQLLNCLRWYNENRP